MSSGRRAALLLGALALSGLAATGCEQKRPAQPRGPWTPYGAQPGQPYYATRGPDPYTLPGGSEARNPWSTRPSGAALAPTTPAVSAAPYEAGPFLIVTTLQGPSPSEREPAVNALLARLGGVRRAPALWEMTPLPGRGLGMVAAALEAELCAEDIVAIYRVRGQTLERSEFAGHKVCVAPPAPPPASAPARKPSAADPLRTRF